MSNFAPAAARPPARGTGLFWRLLLTALVTSLPVLAAFAWTLADHVQQARRAATASVLAHSVDVARRIEATLLRLNVVADVLLARNEVATLDSARCGAALQDLPRVDPLILNVGVFSLDGQALCLSRRVAAMPASFRNTAWFREALAHEGRWLGTPYLSPASGRRVLSLTSPVRDDAGRRVAILGLSVDLERLSASLGVERLPPNASVGVVAADGVIVARLPDAVRWIGQRAADSVLQATPAAADSATLQGTGLDGVPRSFGYAVVGSGGWRVYTGVPTAHFSALVQHSSQRGLVVLASALLLGVLVSWAGASWLARPVQRLAQTARRLAAGDESATADEGMPGEVGQLAAEFNHMVRKLVDSRNDERLSRQRWTRLFNVMPVAAAVLDAQDGRLLDANDALCRMYGVAREAAIGRTLQALGLMLPDGVAATVAQALQARQQAGPCEATLRDGSGRPRDLLFSAEPIDWGARQAALAVQVDVTGQHEAARQRAQAERLYAANAAKTAFLSRMSHELRTPMNAILGFTQLLQRNPDGRLDATQLRQLRLVEQAGLQLTALIDDVLDVSRIESGQLQLAPVALDLHAVVDEALQQHEAGARAQGVRLRPAPAPHTPLRVQADPTRLRQVLANLLSNAVKYNRPGGEVAVHLAREQDGWASLVVQDNGLGMTAQQQQALFQPFNRLGRERGPVPGTGIGLVLTRQLVQLHGGTLALHSVEGEGTTVQVRLPLAPDPATPDAPGAADTNTGAVVLPEGALPLGHVLYIEDNPVNALLMQELLRVWPGVLLTIAPDGATGLAHARRQRPDVLLLDMLLPDMSGMDVLLQLRSDAALHDVPVLCLSANAMPEDVASAQAAGANGYWSKPFALAAFLDSLRGWLPGAHQHAA